MFHSCEQEELITLDLSKTVSPQITAPSSGISLILTKETADEEITFTWSPASYDADFIAQTKYILQMDVAGNNFANPRDLINTEGLTYTTTQGAVNSRILGMEFEPETEVTLEYRVFSFITRESNATYAYSNPITITFTTFEQSEPEVSMLWVPGAYQGWNPAVAPNVFSPTDNNIYNGYVHFPAGTTSLEFKFTSDPDWNHTNYGFGGPGVLDTNPGASNLSVSETGTWYFTVNTDELTWSGVKRDFALIGSFNEWNADAPLTWDNSNKVFTITMNFAAGAEFKWRANNTWDFNLGKNTPDDGTLVPNGGNIVIEEAGNYTVVLDLYKVKPTYEVIKN